MTAGILIPPRGLLLPPLEIVVPRPGVIFSVIGRALGFMGGLPPATTVYSDSLPSNNTGNAGYSFRKAITPAAGGSNVRITFKAASSGANFKTDHCSIAVKGSATLPDTQAIPTELLFGGLAGFNIAPGNTIASDWLSFSFTGSDILVVVMDFASSGGGDCGYNSSGSNSTYYKAATASYNTASVSGYTTYGAAPEFGVSKVEVY